MKIAQVCSSDSGGGAAVAGRRLHRALQQAGIDSIYVVRKKNTNGSGIVEPRAKMARGWNFLAGEADRTATRILASSRLFSFSVMSGTLAAMVRRENADIVHLHHIAFGVLSPSDFLSFRVPLVWTLHDSWAFTGGCFLPGQCRRYEISCANCPKLGMKAGVGSAGWSYRKAIWARLPLVAVAPSRWMADRAKRSALLQGHRVVLIPNGVDTAVFKPLDKHAARRILGLPLDEVLVGFVSASGLQDENKGLGQLLVALDKLGARARLVTVGPGEMPTGKTAERAIALGKFCDEVTIAVAMSAFDLIAVPSREENFPFVALEAMACKTPVVAFDAGGVSDLIANNESGVCVPPGDVDALSRAIGMLIDSPEVRSRYATTALRDVQQKFTVEHQARMYSTLYAEILSAR